MFQSRDLTYVHIEFELEILADKISIIEKQLTQERKKSKKTLTEKSTNLNINDLADEAYLRELNDLHKIEKNETLPRLLINPFILTLWSFFESSLIEMSKLCQDKTNLVLVLKI